MAKRAPYLQKVRGKEMWCGETVTPDGKRKRMYRHTKADAERAVYETENEVRVYGRELSQLTVSERSFILRWRDKLTLDKMDEILSRAHEGGLVTCAQAADAWLTMPREKPLSEVHLNPVRSRLKKFVAAMGDRPIAEVSPGDVLDFVRSQGGSAPQYYGVLHAVWHYAEQKEWVHRSPFATLKKPSGMEAEKDTITPEDMRRYLRVCAGADPGLPERYRVPVLRLLILGCFCGLRHSEAMRLQCQDIDLAAKEIHVRQQKTGGERYAAIEPVGLAWLKWCKLPSKGPVIGACPSEVVRSRSRLAGGHWLDNGARRSFGSYHLAAFQDAARTAEIMGHTDAKTTKAKYRVARKQAVALEWFALTPEKVLG